VSTRHLCCNHRAIRSRSASAQVLSAYICRRGSLKGKNVLEIGSGTGLVGLAAGVLGATVWITDQAYVLSPVSV
jgi:protein N-lysine methyltransferase METTL21A